MLRKLVKARTVFTGATAEAAAAEVGLAAAAAETAALRAELEGKTAKALQVRANKAGVPKPALAAANAGAAPKVNPALRSDVEQRRRPHAGSPPRRRPHPLPAGLSAGGGGQGCGGSSSRRTRGWWGARPCARRSMRSTSATTPSA